MPKPYNPCDWFWIVDNDESRFWSSAASAFVPLLPENAGVTRILNETELTDVLLAYGLPGPIAFRRKVRKSVVQARLINAGLMGAAYTALTANPVSFARWFAPDQPEVYADDLDAVALLTAIGADPVAVMAAE
jgi:hypothetical protein